MKKFLNIYYPWLAWVLLIFFFSSMPDLIIVDESIWDLILRKFAHMFVFGLLFYLSWKVALSLKLKYAFIWAIFFSILYACSDEWHQEFVPGRVPSLIDVLIDSVGVVIAYLATTRYYIKQDEFLK